MLDADASMADEGGNGPIGDAGGLEVDAGTAPNDGGGQGIGAGPGPGLGDTDSGPVPSLDAGAGMDAAGDTDSGEVLPPGDGGSEAVPDAVGPAGDAALDALVPVDDATTSDASPTPADAGQVPLDCSGIAGDGVELCDATTEACGAVFTNGMGCTATCAAAGLVCVTAFENVEKGCARDETRPALTCDSGHDSDYCDCRRPSS